jgi:hypothetical protein
MMPGSIEEKEKVPSYAGNSNWGGGRFSTVDLLNELVCFLKREIIFSM